jgi:LysR family glycine cleavage system transcriptional activator
MRHLPPMAAVRVFEAAARLGNFTRAGEELGMTQAAVSYQLKLLEARLGAPLFRRSGRGVVLTPLGERIAPLVTNAFDTLADAFAAVQRENDGVLTISTFNSLASNWLAARIGEFQIANPGIAVRLKIEEGIADLNAGDADVGIRGGARVAPGLAAHFLMRVPVAPLASPALLARYPAVREPGDVLRLPLLSPDDFWWQWWLKQAGGSLAGEAMRGIRLDSQILEGNAAVAGQGVAMLNPTLWRTQLDAGHLVQVHPFVGLDRTVVRLVYPEYRHSVPKIRAFRQWLLREIDRARADDPYGAFTEA